MKRYTQKAGGGYALTADVGDASVRLGHFEDLWEALLDEQGRLLEELEALRAQEKTKSVKFREAMGRKLMNSSLLTLMKVHGLE